MKLSWGQIFEKDSIRLDTAALSPLSPRGDWKMSRMLFIDNRFIYPEPDFPDQSQDLAPFLP